MSKQKPHQRGKPERPAAKAPAGGETTLRIIGGAHRGRKILYSGDERTRPMKDRVRESVFNLLEGNIAGAHAIDLFAGAGALGLEAISRGSARATFLERHFPTAELIERTIATLDLADRCQVIPGDAFIWVRGEPDLGAEPWLVFFSPPYAFYVERADDMLAMIAGLINRAPPGSAFVVESDERLDVSRLPRPNEWDVRSYPPAQVAILRKS